MELSLLTESLDVLDDSAKLCMMLLIVRMLMHVFHCLFEVPLTAKKASPAHKNRGLPTKKV